MKRDKSKCGRFRDLSARMRSNMVLDLTQHRGKGLHNITVNLGCGASNVPYTYPSASHRCVIEGNVTPVLKSVWMKFKEYLV